MKSELEETLWFQLKAVKLPLPIRQFKFSKHKKWASDFAWPDHMLLVEAEGGVFSNGRHVRGKGFTEDCVKYNTALLMGYRVLRVTKAHIDSGVALNWIEQALSK